MIRVLYDHKIWEQQKYGGISRYFYEIIKRNTENHWIKADVCAGFHKNDYGLEVLSNKNLMVLGKKLSELSKIGTVWRAVNVVNKSLFTGWYMLHKNLYDIYHPTYYHIEKRRFKARQVVTVYDMIHELYPQYFSKNDLTSIAKKHTVENADIIIAISKSTKQDLVNILGVDKKKICVIYLANSLAYDAAGSEAIIKKPYILYVGWRRGYKNFVNFIKAYASNSKICSDFLVVVFGGEKINPEERNVFKELGISEKIDQIFGDDAILINLYKNASCFVYPSLYEGFGLPPLEAMHHGCPVIASNVSSIPEVVGEAGLLFNPGEVAEISYTLEKVLYDEELKKTLINAGYRQEKKFSWEQCARETFEIYSQLSI
ncbi:Glycosyltransferase involved in cell wall bisynthesis [Desulfotomaculum arcticum]|uniref:Glycosyltransferase involved in cell wall bisynthesis n=1 Tax=Desulfotruncus arcticus DSM 17038 TaxID=1121424 RepID=A0A1I2VK61_9FIRM|nr:glycosyltransferase family 1 protein [Desulfotruncus arcticus]SFG89715.1 Glycosyltransferase involved in cell wall bisynthesis [Desulfotomaculum arcticum] [Desulfotruncus arcticus DSM 17038]